MRARKRINILCVLTCALLLQSHPANSKPPIVNNNPATVNNNPAAVNNNSQPVYNITPPQESSSCQNNAYKLDPRIPPAGSYVIKNFDGSSQQLYTTGEARPYVADTNCNTSSPTPQTEELVGPPLRRY